MIALDGHRFGRLVVLARASNRQHGAQIKVFWRCRCDCGHEVDVASQRLRRGETKSCGCFSRETTSARRRTHGASGGERRTASSEYAAWLHAKHRCYNPRDKRYSVYGGRGITMCAEWRSDFTAFLAYVGPKPSPQHSLDRYPNNDGNYQPGNVRWATSKQQSRNQTQTILFRTLNNEALCLSDVAQKLAISKTALKRHFLRSGVLS